MKRSLPLVVILLMLGTLKGQSSSSIEVVGLAEALSKTERSQLTKELLDTFEQIEAAVPALSPSQKEWLAGERKAIDFTDSSQDERAWNFHQSQEFTIEYTKIRLLSLVTSLQFLAVEKIANRDIGAREQVFLWSEVAYILIEQQFYVFLARLQKLGFFDDLSPVEMLLVSDPELSSGIYRMKAEDILGSIVMPYLLEQFPE